MPTVRKRWPQAVDSLDDQPLGYRINIFLARLCFRGIYFPMMGKLAWVKVVAQNRHTIFKLVKEAVFGRKCGGRGIPRARLRMKRRARNPR